MRNKKSSETVDKRIKKSLDAQADETKKGKTPQSKNSNKGRYRNTSANGAFSTNYEAKDDFHPENTCNDNTNCDKTDPPVHLNCMYTNADCLLNKRKELEANIATMQPDIIAITEVFPKNAQLEVQKEELAIGDYDCLVSTGGRGVCIM